MQILPNVSGWRWQIPIRTVPVGSGVGQVNREGRTNSIPSWFTVDCPLGPLTLTAENGAVTNVNWGRRCAVPADGVLMEAARQVDEYFRCARKEFDLPLAPAGSEFQRSVWDAMLKIPFGQTCTYGRISRELGAPPQSVGQACGRNPIPILIPCHRVISSTGLGGYSGFGGVETKVALLSLEGAASMLL